MHWVKDVARVSLGVLVSIAVPLVAQVRDGGGAAPDAGAVTVDSTRATTAFVNVSVVPMDRDRRRDRVVAGQTVVVQSGRIVALGPVARIQVPAGARRIDGTGRFLLPGLGDMHVHLPAIDSVTPLIDTVAETALLLALAHGVTTVRNMNGRLWHLTLRERAVRGELLSPKIYTAGPILDADYVKTPLAAARAVAEQAAAGYDFAKMYNGVSRAVFDTAVATAARLHFPIAGHVPFLDSMGVTLALAVPYRSIEHLHGYEGYLLGLSDTNDQAAAAAFVAAMRNATWRIPWDRLNRIVAATRRAHVWNVPTLAVTEHFVATRAQPPLYDTIVMALQRSGAGMLLGTDSWYCGEAPVGDLGLWVMGIAVRRELESLVRAGLTPYEALATATTNVARFWGTEAETGTITIGKRADLVLVDRNPLVSFDGLARPAGVMVGGRWLSRAELDAELVARGVTPNAVKCHGT